MSKYIFKRCFFVSSHPYQYGQASITKTDTGYQLTLQDTDKKMLIFSDRPVRKAGTLKTTEFMANWMAPGSSFSKDHPNAAIVFDQTHANDKGFSQADAVVLSHPTKLSANSWRFELKDLAGKLNVGKYNKVVIFVDDGMSLQEYAYIMAEENNQ